MKPSNPRGWKNWGSSEREGGVGRLGGEWEWEWEWEGEGSAAVSAVSGGEEDVGEVAEEEEARGRDW